MSSARPPSTPRHPHRPSNVLALLPFFLATMLASGCSQQGLDHRFIGEELSAQIAGQPLVAAVSNWGGDEGFYVNLFTGGLVVDKPLLDVPALGFDWDIGLFYNSTRAAEVTMVGSGWHFSYDLKLEIGVPSPLEITVHWGDGRRDVLAFNGSRYVGPPWMLGTTIEPIASTFHLRTKHGLVYVFNAAGQLTALVDRNGNSSTLTYNGAGQISFIVDAAGRTLTLGYDVSGHLVQISGLPAAPLNFVYAGDLLVEARDAAGYSTTYSYDAQSRLAVALDAEGASVNVQYHATVDAVIRVTAGAAERRFDYNPFSLTTSVVDELSAGRTCVSLYTMDSNALVVRVQGPDGVAISGYDPATRVLTSHTDVNGRTCSRTVDAVGSEVSFTDPTGATTTFVREPVFNFVVSTTDALGNVSTRALDPNGNVVAETNPLGATLTIVRTPQGQVQSVTTPLGKTSTFAFSAAGDMISATDPNGATVQATFNARGRPTILIDQAGGTMVLGYDPDERLTSFALPRGGVYQMGYSRVGRLESLTDPVAASWQFAFNERHQLRAETDPLAAVTTFERDRAGAVMRLVDALGHTQEYSRDLLERLVSMRDADGGTWTFVPLTGDLTQDAVVVDPSGATEIRSYTPRYELALRDWGAGLTCAYVQDQVGRLVHAERTAPAVPTVAYDCSYNGAGNLATQVAFHVARTTNYGYDGDGNAVSVSDNVRPAGVMSMLFDGRDLVQRVSVAAPPLLTDVAVSPRMQLAGLTHSNGVLANYAQDGDGNVKLISNSGVGFAATYNIDHDLRGSSIRVFGSSPATGVLDHFLTRDLDARLRDENLPAILVSKHYDLDAVRNRVLRLVPPGVPETYLLSPANRLLSVIAGPNIKTMAWNANGCVTSINEPGIAISVAFNPDRSYKTLVQNAQTWQFLGGPFGEMARVIEPGGTTTWFVEDRVAGRIVRRVEMGAPGAQPAAEYIYAGAVLDADAGVAAKLPSSWNRPPFNVTARRVVLAGTQGPSQVASDTGALVSDTYSDRYGNKIAQTGSVRPRAGFDGMDTFANLNYWLADQDVRARSWYDPTTGTFHLDNTFGSKLRKDEGCAMGPEGPTASIQCEPVEQPIWNRTPVYTNDTSRPWKITDSPWIPHSPRDEHSGVVRDNSARPFEGCRMPAEEQPDWPPFLKIPGEPAQPPNPDDDWRPMPPYPMHDPIYADAAVVTHGFSTAELRALLLYLGQAAMARRIP